MEEFAKPFKREPTKRRPLLGTTILLIEDSRYCSEAVRLMALRCGARLRRADSLRSARKHLMIYKPDVILIDIGLPDGSGIEMVRELRRDRSRRISIAVLSGEDRGTAQQDAMKAGADCFLAKPLCDLQSFQKTVRALAEGGGKQQPFVPQVAGSDLNLDRRALMDDIGAIQKQLARALPRNDRHKLRYLAQFTDSVAQAAEDGELMQTARKLSRRLKSDTRWKESGAEVLRVLGDRMAKTNPI